MFISTRHLVALACAATLGSFGPACGPRPVPPVVTVPAPAPSLPVAEAAPDCALVPGSAERVTRIALREAIDPANAPHPVNESERLLFRQLYETLVRVDCEGTPRPALAVAWQRDPDGVWHVTLRDDARFADGDALTAAHVLAWWTEGGAGALRPAVGHALHRVEVTGLQTLAIAIRADEGESPVALGDAALAIAKAVPGARWPAGTRGLDVVSMQTDAGGRQTIEVAASGGALPLGDQPTPLQFIVQPARDARDFLDEGVDLLLSREPAALAYAATLPQFVPVPLPWQHTHVFVSPSRVASATAPPPDVRQRFAREALRGEARGAEGPFWWERWSVCRGGDAAPPAPPPAVTAARIVHAEGDAASRDAAERIVGLVRGGGPDGSGVLQALVPGGWRQRPQRAEGLDAAAFAAAQARGADAGYVLTLEREPLAPCRAIEAIAERMPWLYLPAVAPLADTRLQAIVRQGRSGLVLEGDGGLLIRPAGHQR